MSDEPHACECRALGLRTNQRTEMLKLALPHVSASGKLVYGRSSRSVIAAGMVIE